MKKISCVICAYNEEERIGNVLAAVYKHPLINEVIVVDGSSIDGTRDIVKEYKGVRLLSCGQKKGKSYAVTVGVAHARNDLLMLLDADLLQLKRSDITKLARPVLAGKADVSLSFRKNNVFLSNYAQLIGLDFISGERVLPKALLQKHARAIARLPSFGLEVFMNRLIIEKGMRIRIVKWEKVLNPLKAKKRGFWKGVYSEVLMVRDILQVVSLGEIIRQNRQMLALAREK